MPTTASTRPSPLAVYSNDTFRNLVRQYGVDRMSRDSQYRRDVRAALKLKREAKAAAAAQAAEQGVEVKQEQPRKSRRNRRRRNRNRNNEIK